MVLVALLEPWGLLVVEDLEVVEGLGVVVLLYIFPESVTCEALPGAIGEEGISVFSAEEVEDGEVAVFSGVLTLGFVFRSGLDSTSASETVADFVSSWLLSSTVAMAALGLRAVLDSPSLGSTVEQRAQTRMNAARRKQVFITAQGQDLEKCLVSQHARDRRELFLTFLSDPSPIIGNACHSLTH